MSLDTVSITRPVRGTVDATDQTRPVQAGTYGVIDTDPRSDDAAIGLDLDPDVIWVPLAAADLAVCLDCGGAGAHHYQVAVDDFDSDDCESCDGTGIVSAETRVEQEADHDRMRSESYT